MTTLAKLNAAIAQFAPRAGAVKFSARQLDDGRIQLEADYPATPESIDLEDAAWTVYGGNQILETAGFDVAKAGMEAYTDKYGDEMIGEWAELTPAPVATSYALRNALTIERVVEIVNEGSDELTSSELAELVTRWAEMKLKLTLNFWSPPEPPLTFLPPLSMDLS